MTYATLMVNLQTGSSNAGILSVAGDLAERFHSRVVGIATAQPTSAAYDAEYMTGDIVGADFERLKAVLDAAETEFRTSLRGRNSRIEWRSEIMVGPQSDYVARQARCADLVLTMAMSRHAFGRLLVDAGHLALQAGRPVLVIPRQTASIDLGHAVVCWRDTREARRAVFDALPLLRQAGSVDVVEIAAAEELDDCQSRLDDVVEWLKAHGVASVRFAHPSRGDDSADLEAVFEARNAGLVVAGAYGHARLREWAFGGVSRTLLIDPKRCSMLSH